MDEKSMTELQVEAFTKALEQENAKPSMGKGCAALLLGIGDHAANAWLLMFAVAIVGFPLGYLPCLLIAFTVASLLGTGTGMADKAIKEVLKIK